MYTSYSVVRCVLWIRSVPLLLGTQDGMLSGGSASYLWYVLRTSVCIPPTLWYAAGGGDAVYLWYVLHTLVDAGSW